MYVFYLKYFPTTITGESRRKGGVRLINEVRKDYKGTRKIIISIVLQMFGIKGMREQLNEDQWHKFSSEVTETIIEPSTRLLFFVIKR